MKITSAEFVLGAASTRQLPRGPVPEFALLGRSNVGKSSLLNRLCGRKSLARISSDPGKTRELNFYLVNNAFHLVDLPGYGFARVPEQVRSGWGELIEDYLRNRKQLAGVVLVVDARQDVTELDLHMAGWLEYYGVRFAVALTKADKLPHGRLKSSAAEARTRFAPFGALLDIVPFSAVTGEGKNDLWRILVHLLEGPRP